MVEYLFYGYVFECLDDGVWQVVVFYQCVVEGVGMNCFEVVDELLGGVLDQWVDYFYLQVDEEFVDFVDWFLFGFFQ